MMKHQKHAYRLSFLSARRSPYEVPELLFLIKKELWEEFAENLTRMGAIQAGRVRDLWDTDTIFEPPTPDLFSQIVFGFSQCGVVKHTRSHARISVALARKHLEQTALTILVITEALFASTAKTGYTPPVLIQPYYTSGTCGSTRSVAGSVSRDFVLWLRTVNNSRIVQRIPNAMREAWRNCSELDCDTGDISAFVSKRGGFLLRCPGDSCDISIPPEELSDEDIPERVHFDSHNVDSTLQQLTLLSGLFQLASLAREIA